MIAIDDSFDGIDHTIPHNIHDRQIDADSGHVIPAQFFPLGYILTYSLQNIEIKAGDKTIILKNRNKLIGIETDSLPS